MNGALWFLAGLGVAILAIALQRVLAAREARDTIARILALAAGDDPHPPRAAEHGEVFRAAREIADARRRDAKAASEREGLLRAALDGTPSAIVVFSEAGRISLANAAARALFFEDQDPQGEDFVALLDNAPDALRRALTGDGDELFSVDDASGERQTYILGKRRFAVDGESMVLVLVKNLSRELHRQETDAWKHMIRMFCHELNNSLAPVSSLIHSARMVVDGAPVAPKLERIFVTISERTEHLRQFLDSYAQFARLPLPRKQEVEWIPLVDKLLALWPSVKLVGNLPTETAWLDRPQIEQVVINLLKNASESGGPSDGVTISIASLAERAVRITVADRGPGMTAEVMERALVPFYSTKDQGSGLGLTLCREIVEAHGGAIRLENRDTGGLAVHVRLPHRSASAEAPDRRLTLTRS